jgi:hypothetical protein
LRQRARCIRSRGDRPAQIAFPSGVLPILRNGSDRVKGFNGQVTLNGVPVGGVVVSHAGYGYSFNYGAVSFSGLASQTEALASRRALIERYVNEAHPPIGVAK